MKEDAEFVVLDKESVGATLPDNHSIAESLNKILSERQAGLDSERDRIDTVARERRKKDDSIRMLLKD